MCKLLRCVPRQFARGHMFRRLGCQDMVCDWSLIASIAGHSQPFTSCLMSPSGRFFMTSSQDGTAMIWSPTGTKMASLRQHTAGIRACAVTPGSEYVVTASEDGTVLMWSVAACIKSKGYRACG